MNNSVAIQSLVAISQMFGPKDEKLSINFDEANHCWAISLGPWIYHALSFNDENLLSAHAYMLAFRINHDKCLNPTQ